MAHTRHHTKGKPIAGSVEGTNGAVYYVTTDANGVISCTCHSWLHGKAAKSTPIEARVCKHLEGVFAGTIKLKAPAGFVAPAGPPVVEPGKRKFGGLDD